MTKLISKYKKYLIALLFVYIYLLMVLLVPSNYYALLPGDLTNTNNDFTFVDQTIEKNDQFNTIYVYSYYRLSVFQQWLMSSSNRYTLYEKNEIINNLSNAERTLQGQISMKSSYQASVIAAYTLAKKNQDLYQLPYSIHIDYDIVGIDVYDHAGDLKIGDRIISIDGQPLEHTTTEEDLYEQFRSSENTFTFLLSNGNEVVIDYQKTPFDFYIAYDIKTTSPEIQLHYDKDIGGPSGGLMRSLGIYASLVKLNISTYRIAGTGTIQVDDDLTVGNIGGIIQKLYASKDRKVDYVFIPYLYSVSTHPLFEDIKAFEKTFMGLYYVKNLEEAVNIIEALALS